MSYQCPNQMILPKIFLQLIIIAALLQILSFVGAETAGPMEAKKDGQVLKVKFKKVKTSFDVKIITMEGLDFPDKAYKR